MTDDTPDPVPCRECGEEAYPMARRDAQGRPLKFRCTVCRAVFSNDELSSILLPPGDPR